MISSLNTVFDKRSPVSLNFLFLLSLAVGLATFLGDQAQFHLYQPHFFKFFMGAPLVAIYLSASAFYCFYAVRRVLLELGTESPLAFYARLLLAGYIFNAFIYPLAFTHAFLAFSLGLCLFFLGFFLYRVDAQTLLGVQVGALEIVREFRRVQWPSHSETLKFVGIVALFVSASSLFWWVIDGMITRVLSFLFNMLS